jgi:hypothetical protein
MFIFMGLSYVWFINIYLWVLSIYAACICFKLFQYESMHLHNVFVFLHFIYKVSQEFCLYMF